MFCMIATCRMVSKEWYDYFSHPNFWKPVFIYIKRPRHTCPYFQVTYNNFENRHNTVLPFVLKQRCNPAVIKTATEDIGKDILKTRLSMFVQNDSDIEYVIYWITNKKSNKSFSVLKPKDRFTSTTYYNHKWMAVPKKEFLEKEFLKKNSKPTYGFTWTIGIDIEYYTERTNVHPYVKYRLPDIHLGDPHCDINKYNHEWSWYEKHYGIENDPQKIFNNCPIHIGAIKNLLIKKVDIQLKSQKERNKRKQVIAKIQSTENTLQKMLQELTSMRKEMETSQKRQEDLDRLSEQIEKFQLNGDLYFY